MSVNTVKDVTVKNMLKGIRVVSMVIKSNIDNDILEKNNMAHDSLRSSTEVYIYAKCDDCGCDMTPESGCNSYWYAENIITVCNACDRRLE